MTTENVKTATDENFETEVLKSATPALVDFWAVWCGPCRAVAPVVAELATAYQGKINVFKLNVDDHPETAAKYGVRSIPTLIFFKNGEAVQRSVGVVPRAELEKTLSKVLV